MASKNFCTTIISGGEALQLLVFSFMKHTHLYTAITTITSLSISPIASHSFLSTHYCLFWVLAEQVNPVAQGWSIIGADMEVGIATEGLRTGEFGGREDDWIHASHYTPQLRQIAPSHRTDYSLYTNAQQDLLPAAGAHSHSQEQLYNNTNLYQLKSGENSPEKLTIVKQYTAPMLQYKQLDTTT